MYAAVVAVEKSTERMQGKAEDKADYRKNHNTNQNFRKQGTFEDPSNPNGGNLVPFNQK